MKFLIPSAVLLSAIMLPAALNAAPAPVYVDNNPCGDLVSMQVNGSTGRVDITTSSIQKCAIGAVTPPPAGSVALNVQPPTGGTITATGINCGVGGSDCSEPVAEGSNVTLKATPNGSGGYSHGTWGVDCAEAGATLNDCVLTNVTAAKSVSAAFTYTPPSPTSCPTGVDCSKTLPWPINPQQNLTQLGNSTVAYKVKMTGLSGANGKVQTAYVTSASANREIALSVNPGDFNVGKYCKVSGTQTTLMYWSQGPSSKTYDCEIPTDGEMWVNIRHTNCPSTVQCGFYIVN